MSEICCVVFFGTCTSYFMKPECWNQIRKRTFQSTQPSRNRAGSQSVKCVALEEARLIFFFRNYDQTLKSYWAILWVTYLMNISKILRPPISLKTWMTWTARAAPRRRRAARRGLTVGAAISLAERWRQTAAAGAGGGGETIQPAATCLLLQLRNHPTFRWDMQPHLCETKST